MEITTKSPRDCKIAPTSPRRRYAIWCSKCGREGVPLLILNCGHRVLFLLLCHCDPRPELAGRVDDDSPVDLLLPRVLLDGRTEVGFHDGVRRCRCSVGAASSRCGQVAVRGKCSELVNTPVTV